MTTAHKCRTFFHFVIGEKDAYIHKVPGIFIPGVVFSDLVVNAPNNFADHELTYLGFNNDAAEIPMHECDRVDLKNNKKEGAKKII